MLARVVIAISILVIMISGLAWIRVERAPRPLPIAGAQRAQGVEPDLGLDRQTHRTSLTIYASSE